ncbi:MAG: RNA polymerase sigma factor [Dehalococcoidales bacterium]|nr:RNA polymerase sigma factor [Dehalococcoidales bacterium]
MSNESKAVADRNAEDAELITRLARGDSQAAVALYEAYFERIYTLIFNQVARNREVTSDIVQETFLAAIKSANKFKGHSSAYTWLYSIALKKVADFYRSHKRSAKHQVESVNDNLDLERLSDNRKAGYEVEESGEKIDDIKQALVDLPLHYSQVLILKYVEDIPVQEISRIMVRSPKSIEGLLTRARRELKELITKRSVTYPGSNTTT